MEVLISGFEDRIEEFDHTNKEYEKNKLIHTQKECTGCDKP